MTELSEVIVRKSSWKHWKLCPKLFDYVWIQKLPSAPGVEQQFGSMFHDGARRFMEAMKDDNGAMLHGVKTWQEALSIFKGSLAFEHPVVGKWMANFFEFEAKRWQWLAERAAEPFKYWSPVAIEEEVLSKKKGYLMHIDRIDRLSDNNLIGIDYKTNKRMNPSDVRGELNFYCEGINTSGRFTERCTMVACYNPQVNRVFVEPFKPRSLAYVERIIHQCRLNILSGDFRPRPQRYCRYCSFNTKCLEAGVFDEEFVA